MNESKVSIIVEHREGVEMSEEQSAAEVELIKKLHEAVGNEMPEFIHAIGIGPSDDVLTSE